MSKFFMIFAFLFVLLVPAMLGYVKKSKAASEAASQHYQQYYDYDEDYYDF
jgi:hypothetical protein